MAARLTALLPRLAALTIIWLLATSTLTFAAASRKLEKQNASAPLLAGPETLIVPDVRGQAYVFAKGILEDGDFAWQVKGAVRGYAANLVAVQIPAPGTKVVDTGSPTVVLRLERNPEYPERGLPEDSSSYAGTKLRLVGEKPAPPKKAKAAKKAPKKAKKQPPPSAPEPRNPDFQVPGAPPEPTDEMPLADRARLLEKRIASRPRPTKAVVRYWLYQHSWLVTGARFGWHNGDEALRILIRIDEDMQARWGIGSRSAAVARAALAEVEAKAAE